MRDSSLFQELEPPPMSAELFATVVIARLRPLGDIVVESQHGLDLVVRVRGETRTMRLEPFYLRYRAAPSALTVIVREALEGIVSTRAPSTGSVEYERIAARLMPLLVTSAGWQRKREAGLRLAVRPWLEDLGTALVVDDPEGITYVELNAFAAWGVDPATAYEQAMRNLAERCTLGRATQSGEGIETLLIDRAEYAPESILLPERLREWSALVGGDLYLGVPRRHFLIGFSPAHPARAGLAAQVEKDAQGKDGLFENLLLYRNGELKVAS